MLLSIVMPHATCKLWTERIFVFFFWKNTRLRRLRRALYTHSSTSRSSPIIIVISAFEIIYTYFYPTWNNMVGVCVGSSEFENTPLWKNSFSKLDLIHMEIILLIFDFFFFLILNPIGFTVNISLHHIISLNMWFHTYYVLVYYVNSYPKYRIVLFKLILFQNLNFPGQNYP